MLHHLVQRARTERAAHHHNHGHVGPQSVICQRLGALRDRMREVAAQRVARLDYAVGREKPLHAVVGDTYTACTPRQNLVRNARIGVLLLYHRGNTHTLRRPQYGGARIASESGHHVGREVAYDAARRHHAAHDLEGYEQVPHIEPPLQPRNGQPDDTVTQRRHLLHLHLALGADKQQLHVVAPLAPESLGHGYRRVDMPPRAATREYNTFFHLPFTICFVAAAHG